MKHKMKIEHYKKTYENGTSYIRSVCKYKINGVEKQINVDAFTPMYADFFLNEIKTNE